VAVGIFPSCLFLRHSRHSVLFANRSEGQAGQNIA
jgi:hypothetical protein